MLRVEAVIRELYQLFALLFQNLMVYVHKSNTISPNFAIVVENEEDRKSVWNYKSSSTTLS